MNIRVSRSYKRQYIFVIELIFFSGPEYVIHNLSFESTYSVRAAAYNVVGYSKYSEEIIKRTKGLMAETVVDGSSMSSSLNSALPSSSDIHGFHRQVALLVLCVVVFTFRWIIVSRVFIFVAFRRPRFRWGTSGRRRLKMTYRVLPSTPVYVVATCHCDRYQEIHKKHNLMLLYKHSVFSEHKDVVRGGRAFKKYRTRNSS